MKKTLLASVIICSSLLFGSLEGLIMAAETGDNHQSLSEISITEGDGSTDPLEPGLPGDETGHTGSLTIDNITHLTFGTQQLSSKKEVYKTTSAKPNVQVTDQRGVGTGWNLMVASSKFSTEEGQELKGAFLKFEKGRVGTTEDNTSDAPLANEVSFELSNDPMIIMSADEDAGLGTWVNRLFNEGNTDNLVSLEVPSGNKVGVYSANLDWTLSDAP